MSAEMQSQDSQEPDRSHGSGKTPEAGGITRRTALGGIGLLGVGAAGLDRLLGGAGPDGVPAQRVVPFYGRHQAGIITPQQAQLNFAAFDLRTRSLARLRELLIRWTRAAAVLTAGRPYEPVAESPLSTPSDPGEALGLPAARLTLTFGFGPTMFVQDGHDRFGLADRKPPALEPLPPFWGDALQPERSGGDLCVQACADDPQVAFHAIHVLTRIGGADVQLRWVQLGFLYPPSNGPGSQTPRDLLGFKDGTVNIRPDETEALQRFVWVGAGDQPAWMRDGTYAVVRRIELSLATWDPLTLEQQERVIGRHKASGAPLGGRREYDPVNLRARDAAGNLVIPANAHIRLATPATNHGQRILRRGYSYSIGTTYDEIAGRGHQLDGGLFFIAFVRDPQRQFVPLQRRLARSDALSAFAVHTGSAVFACPPGVRPGGFIGESLLG